MTSNSEDYGFLTQEKPHPTGAAKVWLNMSDAAANLRVVKWIGAIPVIGVCTVCDLSFTVPLPAIKRVADAQESLRVQFAEQKCKRDEIPRTWAVLHRWLPVRAPEATS
jgi:hypothetical protein